MNSGKAFLGVLVGLTAGTALGILFAPDKGSNTRKKIVKDSEDLANTLNTKIEEKFDQLMNVVNSKVKRNKSQNSTVSSTPQEVDD